MMVSSLHCRLLTIMKALTKMARPIIVLVEPKKSGVARQKNPGASHRTCALRHS